VTIDLRTDYLELVKAILLKHLPKSTKIYAFGSRIKGTAKPFSDLDLAIDAEGKKLPAKIMTNLLSEFEESSLPYKIDLIDFNDISPQFKSIVEQDKVAI